MLVTDFATPKISTPPSSQSTSMVIFETTPSSQMLFSGVTTVITPYLMGYIFTSTGKMVSAFLSKDTEIGSILSFAKARLTNKQNNITIDNFRF